MEEPVSPDASDPEFNFAFSDQSGETSAFRQAGRLRYVDLA